MIVRLEFESLVLKFDKTAYLLYVECNNTVRHLH